jgi:hypothetical protein
MNRIKGPGFNLIKDFEFILYILFIPVNFVFWFKLFFVSHFAKGEAG